MPAARGLPHCVFTVPILRLATVMWQGSVMTTPQLCACSALTACLFFLRRSSTPALFIGSHCATALWALTSQIYQASHHLLGRFTVSDVLRDSWLSLLLLAVYIAYFTLSKRVKATFVTRFPATTHPVAQPA